MSMLVVMCATLGVLDVGSLKVSIACETQTIPMGDTVVVEAKVTDADGKPFLDGVQLHKGTLRPWFERK